MKPSEFAKRRKRLMHDMGNGIAVIPAAPVKLRNRDVAYPYRNDSDFYYLTGFGEEDAVAVLVCDGKRQEFFMFCRPRDPLKEAWHGRRAGPEGVMSELGADQAWPLAELDERLPQLLADHDRLFYAMGNQAEFDQRMIAWLQQIKSQSRSGVHEPTQIVSLDHLVHEMRLIKSAEEIKTMQRAAKISAAAHRRAMAACRPGVYEYQIEAELAYEFRHRGGSGPAYGSIVGGGANACILHYVNNDQQLKDGDLLLIDAAAEYDYYAADITRTFPVNGRFTKPQRAIYDLVLKAQLAAIEQVRPGNHWDDPHQAAVKVITQGLLELGILKGELQALLDDGAHTPFFIHRTGHWLGMDVHDVGDYKVDGVWRQLEPGMVLTVEPGLYIPAGSKGVARKWWNIGVRIEDDVVVTREGHRILTSDAPKDPDAIEALMTG